MLRKHGYKEWGDGHGSMIGASYDWRLTPEQMERRDGFFTEMMEQTEAMVAADPEQRAAVVIGFSLGCRGEAWIAQNIGHFVPLGGPWLGDVQLMKAVMVDGSFAPLDMLFTKSEMLSILRCVPVGRYLQPIGDWHDGLNMPFVFLRDEIYLTISIGDVELPADSSEDATIDIEVNSRIVTADESPAFYNRHPFTEQITFVLDTQTTDTNVKIVLRSRDAATMAASRYCFRWSRDSLVDASETAVVTLHESVSQVAQSESGAVRLSSVGSVKLNGSVLASKALSSRSRWSQACQKFVLEKVWSIVSLRMALQTWQTNMITPTADMTLCKLEIAEPSSQRAPCDHTSDQSERTQMPTICQQAIKSQSSSSGPLSGKAPASIASWHPLEQHSGARTLQEHQLCTCSRAGDTLNWTGTHPLSLGHEEGLYVMPATAWKVPSSTELVLDASAPPPVANVTCIYGTPASSHTSCSITSGQVSTCPHRDGFRSGTTVHSVQAAFELDDDGEVDGLACWDGQGFETESSSQRQQDTGEQVFVSGDGTVNYQSLRHAANWTAMSEGRCQTRIFELPGCDHRGVSSDSRMLALLRGVLGLRADEESHRLEEHLGRSAAQAQKRFGFIEHWACCGIVAKAGLRSLNVFRRRFAKFVIVMAVLSLCICVFTLVYGVNEDSEVIKSLSWGSGGTTAVNGIQEWGFDLGVMTYAYLSQPDVCEDEPDSDCTTHATSISSCSEQGNWLSNKSAVFVHQACCATCRGLLRRGKGGPAGGTGTNTSRGGDTTTTRVTCAYTTTRVTCAYTTTRVSCAYTTTRVSCAYTYSQCKSFFTKTITIGNDTRLASSLPCSYPPQYPSCSDRVSPDCFVGLKALMCEHCYDAGVQTYVALCVTSVIQIPLVWVSIVRTSAASDNRWRKFAILPLTVSVVVGTILVHISWRHNCYDHLHELLTEHTQHSGDFSMSVHWESYIPLIAGFLALCTFVVNMLTPVPELYQRTWLDPQVVPFEENSGPEWI